MKEQSLTDFKQNTARCLKKIKRSKSPVVLTVNGKAELVCKTRGLIRRCSTGLSEPKRRSLFAKALKSLNEASSVRHERH